MSADRHIVVEGLGRLPQFSHAGWAGDTLHVSGTLGTVEGLTLADGVAAQTTRALENMGTILAEAGLGWEHVAKVDVFLADMAESAAYNEAYGAFFASRIEPPPARITVGGNDFAFGARIEMQCVASRSGPQPAPPIASPSETNGGADAPRRRTLTVEHDGESLYVEVLGEGGTPLVLCHGLGGNHAVWFQQSAHFARDRSVIVWDHRGFGRSTDRADRTGPAVAGRDLLAVLDHLGIERADLVGQSMGGWTVVAAALARPSVARSLVLADSIAGFTSEAIAPAMAGRSEQETHGRIGDHPALDPSFVARDPGRALLYQQIGGMGSMDPTVVLPRLLAVTHDAADARRLSMPVLCVVGDRDRLFPPEAVRALTDLFADARLVEVTGSGHSPYVEDPQVWNAVVGGFLTALDR
ncbi:MAG: alpha/beta fold hydrolase [Actinomycetota bacterium]